MRVIMGTDMTLEQLRLLHDGAEFDVHVKDEMKYASSISAFLDLYIFTRVLPSSPCLEFWSKLINGTPREECALRSGSATYSIDYPNLFNETLILSRKFFSRMLSDTNATNCVSSWYDDRIVDALGYEAASGSSGRMFYVNSRQLTTAVDHTNDHVPGWIFQTLLPEHEVICTIAYVGLHWAATWWYPGSTEWFFAEGLDYDVKPTQYMFRKWIMQHFSVVLENEPTRCYIGSQCDYNNFNQLVAINCGVIAARIVQGLSKPRAQRDLVLGPNMPEYLDHIQLYEGNDCISSVTCRLWRFEQSSRLVAWAVRQQQAKEVARAQISQVPLALDMGLDCPA